jgi:MarR family transcriptional regulator, organic hydroperoxide resistance regulator
VTRRPPTTTLRAVTEPSTLSLPPVLQFMQVLWRLVHVLEQRSKRMAVAYGVTGPQRLVLRLVGLQPGISAGELSSILHVHPSTLTGVLRRLQAQGLLVRGAHAADRRRAVLRLTPRGRRINAKWQGTAEAAVAQALRTISVRDQACARRTLAAIAEAADA